MPRNPQYTKEFKEQSVAFVFESMEVDESRKEACRRLCGSLRVKEVTLYNWVKQATPTADKGRSRPALAGSIEEIRAANAQLRKENRELARANEILQAAASFFGAELDRHSKR